MEFTSFHTKGRGRARRLGYPTINLKVPDKLAIDHGVYGVYFLLGTKKLRGAMHFGASPTFKDSKISVEVYLIDKRNKIIPDLTDKEITIEIQRYIRPVLTFTNKTKLIRQIKKDVELIKKLI